ncbi:MAG: hypothetical protein ACI9U2_004038 [Bradymonadia bacterium]|jgi:hypothetical protein
MRIIVVWAQVFVVLPAVHLHEHGHHEDAHHEDAHHEDAHDHDPHHDDPHDAAETHDDGETHEDGDDHDADHHATGDHPDHDDHSAAHLNAAILPTTPTLFTLPHRIPAERPLRAAPAPLDQARAGHGWTPRGPPA